MKSMYLSAVILLAACSTGEAEDPSRPFVTTLPTPFPLTASTSDSSSTGDTSGGMSIGSESTSTGDASSSSGSTSTMGATGEVPMSTGGLETSSSTSSTSSEETTASMSTGTTDVPAFCGDGLVDAGEECDDGPGNADNATCTPACMLAFCGDGLTLDFEEECDDGNLHDDDACLSTCKTAKCGDTFVQAGVEECDDGNAIDDDACSNACVEATCADSKVNGEETGVDCGGPTCKPCSVPGLVINEVDYDNVDTDTAEYIELLNTTAEPIALAGLQVVLVNGGVNPPAVYTMIDLSPAGSLASGQYLVIAPAAFAVPPGAIKVNFAKATDNMQNGNADGLAVIDSKAKVVLDALSYEGPVAPVVLPGFGVPVSLVEGQETGMFDGNLTTGALMRLPNGYDGNNALTDWSYSEKLTPGAANM